MSVCALLASGCVLPTSLQEEPSTVNYRPVLTSADPPFGPITHSLTDVVQISIVAEDPNVGDTLRARLFKGLPDQLVYSGLEITLATDQSDTNRVRRLGGFVGLDLCKVYQNGDALYVVLADAPFYVPGDMVPGHDPWQSTDQLTDENHWELTCR
jgi:hypothetical protein